MRQGRLSPRRPRSIRSARSSPARSGPRPSSSRTAHTCRRATATSILLCRDGLTSMVPEAHVAEVLAGCADAGAPPGRAWSTRQQRRRARQHHRRPLPPGRGRAAGRRRHRWADGAARRDPAAPERPPPRRTGHRPAQRPRPGYEPRPPPRPATPRRAAAGARPAPSARPLPLPRHQRALGGRVPRLAGRLLRRPERRRLRDLYRGVPYDLPVGRASCTQGQLRLRGPSTGSRRRSCKTCHPTRACAPANAAPGSVRQLETGERATGEQRPQPRTARAGPGHAAR